MKDRFKLFSMALCACAFAACNDNEGVDGPGDGDKIPRCIMICDECHIGRNGQLFAVGQRPTKGTIDPTEANGRISFDASNPDFVNYNNELLIGMNYPSQGGTGGYSYAWKLIDGN